jgi:hypothetical protein
MALSDLMLRLGSQAKDLEDSASALHTDNDAKLKARARELHESLSKIKVALSQKLQADSDDAANRWAGLQRTVSDGFETLHAEAAARVADPAQADTAASQAELDAKDAIDFAVYALQEAEYYVLAALAARGDADDEIVVDDIVVTDGETAVEDIIVTDGDSAVETVDTIDIDDPATADEEPTK